MIYVYYYFVMSYFGVSRENPVRRTHGFRLSTVSLCFSISASSLGPGGAMGTGGRKRIWDF